MDIGLSPRKSSLQHYSHYSPQRSTTPCTLGLGMQVLRSTMCFYRRFQKGNLQERWKFAQQGFCQIVQRSTVVHIANSAWGGRKIKEEQMCTGVGPGQISTHLIANVRSPVNFASPYGEESISREQFLRCKCESDQSVTFFTDWDSVTGLIPFAALHG